MRILTFEIGGHRLAIPADAIDSVGKQSSQSRAQALDLRRCLGLGPSSGQSNVAIIFHHGKKTWEFIADRVLNLEEYREDEIKPWPRTLGYHRLFSGILTLEGGIFLMLNLETISACGGRTKR